jgi:ergothioneine biosynthesis protein EgtB
MRAKTDDARRLDREALIAALRAARQASLDATLDLTDEQWLPPYHPGLQPTAWDLAHVAWFAEFRLLRGPHRIAVDGNVHADGAARFFADDARYDSARIGHRERWRMELLPRRELLLRMQGQLDACADAVANGGDSDADLYHARFAVCHELMHVEALWWTRGIRALPAPPGASMATVTAAPEVQVADGEHRIGRAQGEPGFAFDNELPGRTVRTAAFAIDAAPVTNARFLEFVAADGYRRAEFWPGPAGAWLAAARRAHPERWRPRAGGGFEQRWFAEWRPLAAGEPVVHVNAYEAEAFCRFAGRRLPTAAEWEVAATLAGERMQHGRTVWEWTATAFAPYPGFRPGPYSTYSAPWFHHQRELRGGAFATHALMHDARYRNFFLPQRTDVFAGFRTAAS